MEKNMTAVKELPRSMHFVGIAGIGMSGVAQAAAAQGVRVTGSDRALHSAENERILSSLRKQGIRLFEQDGSVWHEGEACPESLVYSTAIEEDNPDFLQAPKGTPRLHRSEAITLLAGHTTGGRICAVAGTSGKTTVSSWLTESLYRLGADPGALCGGLMNYFSKGDLCGNFLPGKGPFVLEADESDKSLLNYTPDSALVLNIGTDHYSREELADVFRRFLLSAAGPVVAGDQAFLEMGPEHFRGRNVTLFSAEPGPDSLEGFPVRRLTSRRASRTGYYCSFAGSEEFLLPAPGLHSALNALAVHTMLTAMGYDSGEALSALRCFSGVWRRFDFAGRLASGAPVYDDYAHNVEKIRSCLTAAKPMAAGRILAVFQPHGFRPLGFMREELFAMLEETLGPEDEFLFLPVYYAGGTSSFTPTSDEVAESFAKRTAHPGRYRSAADRSEAETRLSSAGKDDLVLIMGARDNSLSLWAKKICGTT